jgi:hypothetical protein
MPTVLQIEGYKFKFYSNENEEPPHIHITKGDGNAKFWLVPQIAEAYFYGFTVREQRRIRELVAQHQQTLITAWHEYFG